MNAETAKILYKADAKGIPQVKHSLSNGHGYCAMGIIARWASRLDLAIEMKEAPHQGGCSLCGAQTGKTIWGTDYPLGNEWNLVAHLNNDHGLTFSEIARKLGPDSI